MNPSFSTPARFTVKMSAKLKVKKDALKYKNYFFFIINKNEVLIEASKKSRKASKKIHTLAWYYTKHQVVTMYS